MVESINNLGVMQEQLGRLQRRSKSFQAAVRSVPHTRERTAPRNVLRLAGRWDERLQNAGERCASIRAWPTRQNNLGIVLALQEHLPDAVAATNRDPDRPASRRPHSTPGGTAFMKQGRVEAAIAQLEKATSSVRIIPRPTITSGSPPRHGDRDRAVKPIAGRSSWVPLTSTPGITWASCWEEAGWKSVDESPAAVALDPARRASSQQPALLAELSAGSVVRRPVP